MFSSNASQVSSDANFIEDVFSTYLYTGNGATQTITNGVDLAGKGGMVWCKSRSNATYHILTDSARGVPSSIYTNTTDAADNTTPYISAFNSNGFNVQFTGGSPTNTNAATYASWTFRKQPKFFDVVTYTGDGAFGRTINHSLASIPGCVIIKRLDTSSEWLVWHQTDYFGAYYLNRTYAKGNWLASSAGITDTTMRVDGGAGPMPGGVTFDTNAAGGTYVAYLFAHDAGGFGLSGNENVISCGSYVGDGTTDHSKNITLGFEPQWILVKRASTTGNWFLIDTMRGMPVGVNSPAFLYADINASEDAGTPLAAPTATGFTVAGSNINNLNATVIYIAIRRGPMKVPTDGTKVFAPVVRTGTNAVASITGLGFAPDSALIKFRTAAVDNVWYDRLRGPNLYLSADNTNPEVSYSPSVTSYNNTGITFGDDLAQGVVNANGVSYINYLFGRAPSFFDEVCYTGTGGASQTFTHNLGVAPELVIVKNRDAAAAWESLGTALSASQRQIYLNRTQAGVAVASGHLGWNGTDGAYKAPTSSVVYFGGDSDVGGSGVKYVAYLFATCAGVSKVGSYTGTGTTQAIACGFTTGARFVMIKRTDAVGDWYVWDSARGIVAGNDPYLLINDAAAEVTSTDYIDTSAAGFEITSTAPAAINAVGGSYIFLAIS